jgi:hypothetical protein
MRQIEANRFLAKFKIQKRFAMGAIAKSKVLGRYRYIATQNQSEHSTCDNEMIPICREGKALSTALFIFWQETHECGSVLRELIEHHSPHMDLIAP